MSVSAAGQPPSGSVPQHPEFGAAPANIDRSLGGDIAPQLSEIIALAGVLLLNLLVGTISPTENYKIINFISPALLSIVLGYGMAHMLRSNSRHIWTALFWFRLSTAAYFGVGVIIVSILDQNTFDYISAFFPFYDADIFKINTLILLSVLLTLSTARFVIMIFFNKRLEQTRQGGGDRWLLIVGTVFSVIGTIVNYGLKTPQDFGWINAQIPGSILNLVRLTMAGIFLLTLWSIRRKGTLLPYVLFVLISLELVFQLLRFSKAGILMTMIFFLLAFLWDKASYKRLGISAALVVAAYAATVPVVSYGRQEMVMRYGEGTPVGFVDRFDVLQSYFTDEADIYRGNTARQSALLRITYVNSAAFVIHQYDIGAPGTWPRTIPAVFIPRFLWPSKPIISDVGLDIYELGTGNRTSSMGAGIFADAYWAAGWWGVLIFMPILGAIMAVLTAVCTRFILQERWLYFPVILMGMLIGFRADGHYLVDIIGGTVILFAQLLLLALVDWYVNRSGAQNARARASTPASFPHLGPRS